MPPTAALYVALLLIPPSSAPGACIVAKLDTAIKVAGTFIPTATYPPLVWFLKFTSMERRNNHVPIPTSMLWMLIWICSRMEELTTT
jgi:hypothetical protein